MDISWDDAQTFLAVAEGASISAGAAALGLGQPTVSRRVAQLEARLGVALFVRSQRGVSLTEAGGRLVPAAEQMARWAGEFGRLASGAEAAAEGVVRIAAPPALSVEVLAPMARTLMDAHPALRLEIRASVEYVDLARGEADLALRTRAPREPELVSIAHGESAVGVFAASDYVAALGRRRAATGETGTIGLETLDWITWSRPYEHVAPRPMLERAIPDFTPRFASDDFRVLQAATRAGLGAMILDVHGAARAGLVEIDVGFRPPPSVFHLVCARSMRLVPRVRLVAERLIATLEAVAAEA